MKTYTVNSEKQRQEIVDAYCTYKTSGYEAVLYWQFSSISNAFSKYARIKSPNGFIKIIYENETFKAWPLTWPQSKGPLDANGLMALTNCYHRASGVINWLNNFDWEKANKIVYTSLDNFTQGK